ncbi:ArdC-like ssDNA-binding domain-containing protein [Rhizobium ruizarguesonis]|uniref:ArdC-like ssDNA-binding domain-containing protein n=1 Tax=Rhizobium ruizarguesonis TaxID=2081791 RepID=UPI0029622DED|nr:ArdC-like ssDNA-binding domain-containing protein [Rhizobium ruizarguesonis]
MDKGYSAPIWMTFKQAQELGASVRKGERGSLVVYANTLHRTGTDEESGEELERDIPYIKGYTVFKVEQIDGLPEHYTQPAAAVLNPVQRLEAVESFFASTGAGIQTNQMLICTAISDSDWRPLFLHG